MSIQIKYVTTLLIPKTRLTPFTAKLRFYPNLLRVPNILLNYFEVLIEQKLLIEQRPHIYYVCLGLSHFGFRSLIYKITEAF